MLDIAVARETIQGPSSINLFARHSIKSILKEYHIHNKANTASRRPRLLLMATRLQNGVREDGKIQ